MLTQGTVCYFVFRKGREKSTTHPCFKLETENMKRYSPDILVLYQSQLKERVRAGDKKEREQKGRERERERRNFGVCQALRGNDSYS